MNYFRKLFLDFGYIDGFYDITEERVKGLSNFFIIWSDIFILNKQSFL